MGSEFRIECGLPDADATHALGRAIGARLESGDGVALVGDLGAGKTTLTRGIAEGLGIDDPGAVTSPTYLVVVEHRGPVPLVHVDAYLPEKTRGFLLDGGVDYLGQHQRGVRFGPASILGVTSDADHFAADAVALRSIHPESEYADYADHLTFRLRQNLIEARQFLDEQGEVARAADLADLLNGLPPDNTHR